jgi:hypothetical protein
VKKRNFKNSFFISTLVFGYAFYMLRESETIFFGIVFVFTQIILFLVSTIMILLRLVNFFKNKNSRAYYLAGIFQIFLALTDVILMLAKKDLTRVSLLIFLGINLFLGTCIFADIYNEPADRDRR